MTKFLMALLCASFPTACIAANPGIQEFTTTSMWLCPKQVTSVQLELWGAGGGAGGDLPYDVALGSGGGGGAYIKSRIAVKPGKRYQVVVGTGGSEGADTAGTGGHPPAQDGQPGGASMLVDPNGNPLATANGGTGGGARLSSQVEPAPGQGGRAFGLPGILRHGTAGIGKVGGWSVVSSGYLYGYPKPELDFRAHPLPISDVGRGGGNYNGGDKTGHDGYAVLTW